MIFIINRGAVQTVVFGTAFWDTAQPSDGCCLPRAPLGKVRSRAMPPGACRLAWLLAPSRSFGRAQLTGCVWLFQRLSSAPGESEGMPVKVPTSVSFLKLRRQPVALCLWPVKGAGREYSIYLYLFSVSGTCPGL